MKPAGNFATGGVAPANLLKQEILEHQNRLQELHASNSWRITAPLRWLRQRFKTWFGSAENANIATVEASRDYTSWLAEYDDSQALLGFDLQAQMHGYATWPLFSITLTCSTEGLASLEAAIRSVQNQTYPNWELYIVICGSADLGVQTLVESYCHTDARINMISNDYAAQIGNQPADLADACNRAIHMICAKDGLSNTWILKIDATDLVATNALNMAANAINSNNLCQIIYADEDVIDANGHRSSPNFKCDWNLDLHLSRNLIGRFGIYKAELVHAVGGFRCGMLGEIDFDLSLRCIAAIQVAQICHISNVLFHAPASCDTMLASDEGVVALKHYFERVKVDAKAINIGHGYRIQYALPKVLPLVSLIIPTRNGLDLIRQCIKSIQEKTNYQAYEIIVVDNGSDEPAVLDYFKSLLTFPNIQVLRVDAPFNYSALNNFAAKHAKGELICLLNNDVEVISPDWLSEMVGHALRPDVGAVGARLWFPDNSLQHGGVILGLWGLAGHAHLGLKRGQLGYHGRAALAQNYSAVTAACLVIRRSIFDTLGGLNESDLPVAFNDIDFCLRVKAAGYRNVWTPFAELYHHESATRGMEDTPEKQLRFSKEAQFMHQRWGSALLTDPAYNANLTLAGDDFGLAWPPRFASKTPPSYPHNHCQALYLRLQSLRNDTFRIAYFAENTHSSTYRYRAANMTEVLNAPPAAGSLATSAACFFANDLQHAVKIAETADLLVISRARYDAGLAGLVTLFKTQGKRVLFDIDDLVFDVNDVNLVIASQGQVANDEVLNYWFSVVGRMSSALRLCDEAITTNSFLAAKIDAYLNKPVHVVPNFINEAQWQTTLPLYQAKLASGFSQGDRIKLGYFSGSASHNHDLALLASAIEQLMLDDVRVDLVLVGHVDVVAAFGERFGGYLQGHLANRVFVHDFTDYLRLQKLIADVDFNLVPLQINDFTHCKSELKYFDAAAVGTVTIASPTFAYATAIKHGVNGYLAANHDWGAALRQAIEERHLYANIAQAAHQDVQQRFVWWQQRAVILDALGLNTKA